ncbi:hypothetical protein LguiB_036228 [Lonicera macranthoides]
MRETSTEAPYLKTNPLFKKFYKSITRTKGITKTLMHTPVQSQWYTLPSPSRLNKTHKPNKQQ